MTEILSELAARRRFGMKPGLDSIRALCAALGNPERRVRAIHIAGTNGKGAVAATLDAALRAVDGLRIGRYTSPHLVKLNERFFLDGTPIDEARLEASAQAVAAALGGLPDVTFFEALTGVAFQLYGTTAPDYVLLECGLGGRLDATNICEPTLCVITKIGLDHCDWLGDTVEKIAAEKAGILKPGVPVVLGPNDASVRAVIAARAKLVGAPFYYAPDLASPAEIPADFSLAGAFNRENAVTALAALKVLLTPAQVVQSRAGFSHVVWPGRFQRIGDVLVDGAHNPPAAQALAETLAAEMPGAKFALIAGFCGDKDVREVLHLLAPFVRKGYAVRTSNPRSLVATETAALMTEVGLEAVACDSLPAALALARREADSAQPVTTLVAGSLFLAGEALVALGAYPWGTTRCPDPSEWLKGACRT